MCKTMSLTGMVGIQHRHFGAMDHDVCHFEIFQIQNAAQHVAVCLDEGFFLVMQVNGTAQFIMGGKHGGILAHVNAKEAEGHARR